MPPELRDKNWEMSIFDDDTVQAFAMPGGKIGVHNGLLKAARNQDQLAAVIGHEVAHVTSRHMNEDVSRAMMSGVGIQVAAILLGGGHSGATYTAYEALEAGAVLGLNLPFSRAQETEADVVGLEYMARAGFDPREAVPLWQQMMAEAGDEGPPEFLSTHPSGETRIDSLVSQWSKTLPLYNEAIEEGRRPNCQPPAEKIDPE
jgi:predicted Zn-dependent protease